MPETKPNESSAWNKAQRAVSELFDWYRADTTQTTQPESDKKQMLFVLADKNNPRVFNKSSGSWTGDYHDGMDKGMASEMGGHPTVYSLNSAQEGIHDPDVVIRMVLEHVKKYGTLSELRISGHGYKNHMGMSADLFLPHFLHEIEDVQRQLGIKITDRIVFGGCGAFSDLTDNNQQLYKDYARVLGTEIVGSTTKTFRADDGRFIVFTPKGTIERDKLDKPDAYQADLTSAASVSNSGDEWFEGELKKPLINAIQKSKTDNAKRGKQGIP